MSRKLMIMCLFVLCLGILTSSAFAGTLNYMVNPSFEDGPTIYTDPNVSAPPWSLWEGTGGAVATPTVLGVTPSPRCWFNTGGSRNLAAQNNLNLPLDTTGTVVYHVKARIYVPALVPGATKASCMIRLHCITGIAGGPTYPVVDGDPIVLDDASAAGEVPVGEWVTKEFDWVNTTGSGFAQWLTFRMYSRDASGRLALAPDVYIDDTEFSITAFSVSGTITLSPAADPTGVSVVLKDANGNAIASTTVADSSGAYSFMAPPGTYTVAASKAMYTEASLPGVTVVDANVTGANLTVTKSPTVKLQGKVVDSVSGVGIEGVLIAANAAQGAGFNPASVRATTDVNGNYEVEVLDPNFNPIGTFEFYILAKKLGYQSAAELYVDTTGHTGSMTLANIPLSVDPNYDPSLLLYVTTDSLGGSGWPAAVPADATLTAIQTPSLEVIGTTNWELNHYADGDGYRFLGDAADGSWTAPIPCNGASIIAVVKPQYRIDGGWGSVVNCFYNDLMLNVNQVTGRINVVRKGIWYDGPILADGQKAVLSAIIQPTGEVSLWVNGVQAIASTVTSPYTEMTPGGAGYAKFINIGRNNPDGWSTYNGYIGDVLVYKTAIDNAKRLAVEASLGAKFGINTTVYTIESSVTGVGGAITPAGTLSIAAETNAAFTIIPSLGYRILDVKVDGVSDMVAIGTGSYTFTNVLANHTIVASFELIPPLVVSGKVTNGTNGIMGAKVYFKLGANASVSPLFETTTVDATGAYSQSLPPGDWFVCASADTYATSADVTVTLADAPVVLADIVLAPDPNWDVLFSAITSFGGATGDPTGVWNTTYPAGGVLNPIGSPLPTVTNDGTSWANVSRTNSSGFNLTTTGFVGTGNGGFAANGVSVVTVVQPTYWTGGGEARGEVVNLYYNGLSLAVSHATGELIVCRKGTWNFATGYFILDGQKKILSLVCQPDGSAILYANGVSVWTGAAMGPGTFNRVEGTDPAWMTQIGVGRNSWDGWSAFNGNVGDVYVFKVAIDDTRRLALEAELKTKFNVNTDIFTVTASAGTNGTISPTGVVVVPGATNKTFTITPTVGYKITDVKVDGVSALGSLVAGAGFSTYTFTNVLANHTIEATFEVLPAQTVTGKVTNGTAGIAGAVVGAKLSANANVSPNFTATTDANGNYTLSLPVGNWFVAASAVNYAPSADTAISVTGPTTVSDIVLVFDPNYDLIFKAFSTDLTAADGAVTGAWNTAYPVGGVLTQLGTPKVQVIGGTKWEKNTADGDGFRFGTQQTTAIPVNGVSAVVVVKMPAVRDASDNWDSIVDVFYDRFCLAVRNDTGLVIVRRNGNQTIAPAATALIQGQKVVLSCVVQPSGVYKVYANGTMILENTTATPMLSLDPKWNGGALGFWSYINVGKNEPDGWPTFHGNIGDVYLFKTAISDEKRTALEASLVSKFAVNLNIWTINASAGVGGTISPAGAVPVPGETDKTFTITPGYGYKILDVVKDGISLGAVTTATFVNVNENGHTIAASFEKLPGISGTVTDANGPINLALVSYSTNADGSAPVYTTKTDATGAYALYPPVNATYYLVAKKSAHVTSAPKSVGFATTDVLGQDFVLEIKDGVLVNINAAELAEGAWGTQLWTNTGTLGGTFGPVGTAPVVATITDSLGLTKKAVTFAGAAGTVGLGTGLQSTVNTTADFTGNSDWTISSWVYVPAIPASNNRTYFSWASRGTNFSSAEMRYNNDRAFSHFGADYGFNTTIPVAGVWHNFLLSYDGTSERLYVDGVLTRTVASIALTLKTNEKMFVGRATEAAGTSNYAFTGSVASVKIWDEVLTTAQAAAEGGASSITATAGPNGTIATLGLVYVAKTMNRTYTITPNTGYLVADVLVDGVSVGAVTTYTFTNVLANHTIDVTFKSDRPTGPVYGANNKSVATDSKLVGKLVKVWGKIMDKQAAYYVISDGYSTGLTINGTTTLNVGDIAVVTGQVNADKTVTAF